MEFITSKYKRMITLSLLIFGGTLLTLFIFGTFWDYQIAGGMMADHGGGAYWAFGIPLEVLGFLPAILVNVALFMALSVHCKKRVYKVLFFILGYNFLAGAIFCSVFWTMSNHYIADLSSSVAFGISAGIALPLSFPVRLLFTKIKNEQTMRRLVYVLGIGFIMASFTNLITGVMQVTWGRYRFFEVVNNNRTFTEWFRPFGRISGFEGHGATSFPSLHASSVMSMMVLPMVGWALGSKRNTMRILWIISAVMLICVPISRMVLGWHYLTDVMFSMIIGVLMFALAMFIVHKLFRNKVGNFLGIQKSNTQDIKEGNIEN